MKTIRVISYGIMKTTNTSLPPSSRAYRPPVGARLYHLLAVVLGLFALSAANAVYLLSLMGTV